MNTLLVIVDMTMPSFGKNSSKGAYEEVIHVPTSSLIHLWDSEIIILVLRTRFLHITTRIHQNVAFLAKMCTHLRFCVYVATPWGGAVVSVLVYTRGSA